jgi:hypothetical protein
MSARGETIIQVDGKEVRVLFDNRALAEAEGQMGKSIIATLSAAQAKNDIAIRDLAQILRAGMSAARRDSGKGKPATLIEAFAVLNLAGFTLVAKEVMTAVAAVLSYDPTKKSADGYEDEDEDPNE